jgi:hypothetical protein
MKQRDCSGKKTHQKAFMSMGALRLSPVLYDAPYANFCSLTELQTAFRFSGQIPFSNFYETPKPKSFTSPSFSKSIFDHKGLL